MSKQELSLNKETQLLSNILSDRQGILLICGNS